MSDDSIDLNKLLPLMRSLAKLELQPVPCRLYTSHYEVHISEKCRTVTYCY